MNKTVSNTSKGRARVQIPVVQHSYSKFTNATYKNSASQTVPEDEDPCKNHSQQITELLTEVAITLGHKAKLENQISEMRNDAIKKEQRYNEAQRALEKEIDKLKNILYEKDYELSKLRISYLTEQKDLLNQVHELKGDIKTLSEESDRTCEKLRKDQQHLLTQINITQEDIRMEAERNNILQVKVVKYKNKFKYLLTYMQKILDNNKNKQNKGIDTSRKSGNGGSKPNMESMVLSELFFKPNPLPVEIEALFFNQIN